jgi:hypothetical protein
LTSISDLKICSERQRQHEHSQARARTGPAGAAGHKQKSRKERLIAHLVPMNRDFNDMLQKQIDVKYITVKIHFFLKIQQKIICIFVKIGPYSGFHMNKSGNFNVEKFDVPPIALK